MTNWQSLVLQISYGQQASSHKSQPTKCEIYMDHGNLRDWKRRADEIKEKQKGNEESDCLQKQDLSLSLLTKGILSVVNRRSWKRSTRLWKLVSSLTSCRSLMSHGSVSGGMALYKLKRKGYRDQTTHTVI